MRNTTLCKYPVCLLIAVSLCGTARADEKIDPVTIDPNKIDPNKIDQVVVDKFAAGLYLQAEGKTVETFHVVFGAQPQGHKQQEGDERTPEGNYLLDVKNSHSHFYKAIHISYPNAADRALAKSIGVYAGGDIMIHGQPNGWGWFSLVLQRFNWTDGCIALANDDMEVVWHAVELGTPIKILP